MRLSKANTKKLIITAILIAVFVYLIQLQEKKAILTIIKTDGSEITFHVEVVTSHRQQELGLMNIKSLPKNDGMLFLFDKPQEIEMWMKNTYIPLDMIFIDKDRRIINIAKNTTPESEKIISSGGNVIAVLEINAMLTDEYSIDTTSKVRWPSL